MRKCRPSRIRFVRQTAVAECGLACIAMAASAYGCDIALFELRKRHPTTLRGMTVRQVVRVANSLGFHASAVTFELEGIKELTLPAVLHWEGDHFVVLSKVTKDGITVLDPNWGRRHYKTTELEGLVTGVAIDLHPTDRISVGSIGQNQNAFKPIIDELKTVKGAFLKVILTALYLEALVIAVPLLFSRLLNTFASAANRSTGTMLIWALLTGTAAIWALRMSRSIALMHLSAEVKYRFISKLIPRLLSRSFEFFRQWSAADLMYRLNGAEQFRNMVTDECVSVVADGLMAIVILLAMAYLNPGVALTTFVAVILIAACRFALSHAEAARFDDIIHLRGKESVVVDETLRAARAIKLFGKEDERAALWGRRVRRTLAQEMQYSRAVIFSTIVPAAASELVVVGTVGFQILFAPNSSVTVGTIFAFYVYQRLVLERCQAIASRAAQFNILQLYMNRMADVLEDTEPREIRLETSPQACLTWPQTGTLLEVTSLSFGFGPDAPPTLANVSFSVQVGQFIGLYGRSGVGKTTLLELLLGTRDATAGKITWAGVPIERINQRDFRRSVIAVTQDDVTLAGTIEENITFLDEDPDVGRMHRAARAAKLERDILEMPLQYSTSVGDGGCALSGGQRQRLLLARALYAEPLILIIDEGTNEIDAATEAEIYGGLKRLGITLIVVAHRGETLRLADRTMVLENGRLRESEPCRTAPIDGVVGGHLRPAAAGQLNTAV